MPPAPKLPSRRCVTLISYSIAGYKRGVDSSARASRLRALPGCCLGETCVPGAHAHPAHNSFHHSVLQRSLRSINTGEMLPDDLAGIEDRAIRTAQAVSPPHRTGGVSYADHTGLTRTHPAGHHPFHAHLAGDPIRHRQTCHRPQHLFRAACVDHSVRSPDACMLQGCSEPVNRRAPQAARAVVGRHDYRQAPELRRTIRRRGRQPASRARTDLERQRKQRTAPGTAHSDGPPPFPVHEPTKPHHRRQPHSSAYKYVERCAVHDGEGPTERPNDADPLPRTKPGHPHCRRADHAIHQVNPACGAVSTKARNAERPAYERPAPAHAGKPLAHRSRSAQRTRRRKHIGHSALNLDELPRQGVRESRRSQREPEVLVANSPVLHHLGGEDPRSASCRQRVHQGHA